MSATEFLTMAFTLSCLLGPAAGAAALLGLQLVRWLDKRGFLFVWGLPPKEKSPKWED